MPEFAGAVAGDVPLGQGVADVVTADGEAGLVGEPMDSRPHVRAELVPLFRRQLAGIERPVAWWNRRVL